MESRIEMSQYDRDVLAVMNRVLLEGKRDITDVRREKVLIFRGIDVTLQMFHPPTLVPGQL